MESRPVKSKERYVPGYTANASDFMAARTAQSHAAFLLPRLHRGLRLLDCGCGTGTITLGLGRSVAPAEVIGLDKESSQIERAREETTKPGVTNVRFEVGSVYELPFADGSFGVI